MSKIGPVQIPGLFAFFVRFAVLFIEMKPLLLQDARLACIIKNIGSKSLMSLRSDEVLTEVAKLDGCLFPSRSG